MAPLAPDLIKRLTYSKYLWHRARSLQALGTELASAEAVLAAQDAAEMVMRVVSDHTSAKQFTTFMEFWENVKLVTGKAPPHKSTMDRLNHMRVGFKHKGNLPNRATVADLLPLVAAFCEETVQEFAGINLNVISLADLVENVEARKNLEDARVASTAGDIPGSLTFLRSAFDALTAEALKRSGQGLIPQHEWGKWMFAHPDEKQFAEALDVPKLAASLTSVIEAVNNLSLGIDPVRLRHFVRAVPTRLMVGLYPPKEQFVWRYRQPKDLTIEDYEFCYDFVIDYALTIANTI